MIRFRGTTAKKIRIEAGPIYGLVIFRFTIDRIYENNWILLPLTVYVIGIKYRPHVNESKIFETDKKIHGSRGGGVNPRPARGKKGGRGPRRPPGNFYWIKSKKFS
jgi:hypothetical protein